MGDTIHWSAGDPLKDTSVLTPRVRKKTKGEATMKHEGTTVEKSHSGASHAVKSYFENM